MIAASLHSRLVCRTTAFSLLSLLAVSCSALDNAPLDAARRTVDEAEAQASSGDLDAALRRLLDRLGEVGHDGKAVATLSHAAAGVYQQMSSKAPPDRRDGLLREAERHYRRAVKSDAGELSYRRDLALLLVTLHDDDEAEPLLVQDAQSGDVDRAHAAWLAIAELRVQQAKPYAAMAALRAAHKLKPADELAPKQIVELVRSGKVDENLAELSNRFAASGATGAALAALELLLEKWAGNHERPWGQYLDRWAELAATKDRVDPQRLQRIRFADRGSRYDNAVAELAAIIDKPDKPEFTGLQHWSGAERERILAAVARSRHRQAAAALAARVAAPQPRDGVLATDVDPRRGVYLGATYGWTDGSGSSAELQSELNRRTPAGRNVTVDLDDTDNGYKGLVGYRFLRPFALELAYTDLDGPTSTIDAPTVDANLPGDVLELHPIAGRGPSLSLLGFPFEYERLSVFGKLGVWYWKSSAEVKLGNSVIRRNPSGWDLIGGVGVQFRLYEGLSARLEYERYFLDVNEVDLLSLGVVYRF